MRVENRTFPKKNSFRMKKNDGSSLYCQLSQLAFGPFRSQRPGAFDSEPTHYLPQKTRDIIWPILCFTASVSCHAPSRRVAPSSKIHRLSLKKKMVIPLPTSPSLPPPHAYDGAMAEYRLGVQLHGHADDVSCRSSSSPTTFLSQFASLQGLS